MKIIKLNADNKIQRTNFDINNYSYKNYFHKNIDSIAD